MLGVALSSGPSKFITQSILVLFYHGVECGTEEEEAGRWGEEGTCDFRQKPHTETSCRVAKPTDQATTDVFCFCSAITTSAPYIHLTDTMALVYQLFQSSIKCQAFSLQFDVQDRAGIKAGWSVVPDACSSLLSTEDLHFLRACVQFSSGILFRVSWMIQKKKVC